MHARTQARHTKHDNNARTHALSPCRFYTATVTSIYSGVFEFWTSGTDKNLDPAYATE